MTNIQNLSHIRIAKEILKQLSEKPLSTRQILIRVQDIDLFIETFIHLRKKGAIEMIGIYPCACTGKETPYYLGYSDELRTWIKNETL